LTTRKWCGVLSDVQWKRNWPQVDNDSMDGKYDGEVFYRYGCPEFFGSLNDAVKSSKHTINMDLNCGCNPSVQNLEDPDFRYGVMYWLTTETFLSDLLKLDEAYQLTRSERSRLRRRARLHAFVFLSKCSDPVADRPWQSNSPACRKRWIEELRDIMVKWDGFSDDIQKPSFFYKHNIGDMDAAMVDVSSLSDSDVERLEFNLFKFLMQRTLKTLGHFPAGLLPFPCYDPFLCPTHQDIPSY